MGHQVLTPTSTHPFLQQPSQSSLTAKSKRCFPSRILPDLSVTFGPIPSLFLHSCPPLASRQGSSPVSFCLAGHSLTTIHHVLDSLKTLFFSPFLKCQLFSRTLISIPVPIINRNHTMSLFFSKPSIALHDCPPSHYLSDFRSFYSVSLPCLSHSGLFSLLKCTNHPPASGPLHWLCFLCGTLFLQVSPRTYFSSLFKALPKVTLSLH